MIRKSMPSGSDPTSGHPFFLVTNAERVCAEIMRKQEAKAFSSEVGAGSREENASKQEARAMTIRPEFIAL
jgi:hypothetical protein